jgi:hypothetical protein
MPGRFGRGGEIVDIYAGPADGVIIDSGCERASAWGIDYSYFVSMAGKRLVNKFLKKSRVFLDK